MIPTLWGRIQTRLFLFFFIGGPITLFVSFWISLNFREGFGLFYIPIYIHWISLIVGLVLDGPYILIQRVRWDRDWPFAFQFLAGAMEGIITYLLVRFGSLPGLDFGMPSVVFFWHYGSIFLISFLVLFGPLKTISPRWRYHGGKFFAN